ncbi:uncharacterized protein SAPINGB_P002441 [Magnusiomyces paraingens]|uniref:Splicing factor YJU2 n=1 Tax=Magnusiomyces paraingens TaxID=2606893 RepID=A0A5E8BDX8_9ASCO|nr:uncharacterized protein SAPINGB_P002441 [Saprochaete ingens]VVT49783.1 unnamed protein product [Saprochaete ingens]
MADRKTINKYYPPDFDPSKILRAPKRDRSAAAVLPTVRLMAPFSMRCTTCGEYIYKGKKFNARKQLTGDSYLGIKVIRFYIRCPRCASEIRFKTNPKNADYATELGAVRNYETVDDKAIGPEETLEDRLDRLEKEDAEERARLQRQQDLALSKRPTAEPKPEGADAMDLIESQMEATRREIEQAEELDALYRRSKVLDARAQATELLDGGSGSKKEGHDDEDEEDAEERDAELARELFKAKRAVGSGGINGTGTGIGALSSLTGLFSGRVAKPVRSKKKKGAVRQV